MCRCCKFDAVSVDSFAELCEACEREVERIVFEFVVRAQTAAHDAAVAEQDEVAA